MKRLLAFLVCFSMVFTCMSGITLTAFASDVITQAGISGSGTSEDPYIIDTAAKFMAIFSTSNTDTANTFDSVYYLTADIDLSALSYVPSTATFTGSLIGWDAEDGVKAKREINIGTISHAGSPIVVSNSKNTEGHVGGIINKVEGTSASDVSEISYLIVKGTVTCTSDAVSNSGTGGVIGATVNYVNVSHIDNYVDVNGKLSVGGIVGTNTKTTSPIEYCNNYGIITSLSGAYGCGGIAGLNYSTISYSNNYGVVDADTNYGGGIVGMGYNDVNYCSNQAPVSSKRLTGGIMSYAAKSISNLSQTLTVRNSWNSGKVTSLATPAAGGIIGGVYLSAQQTSHVRPAYIYDCYNRGAVENTHIAANVASAIGDTFAAGYNLSYKKNASTAEVAVKGGDRQCKIIGYYDSVNKDMPLVKTTFAASDTYLNPELVNKTTVTDVYVIADSESTDATYGTSYVTKEGLKALTTAGYFADSEAWETAAGYPYPSIVNNPATSDIFLANDIAGAGTENDPYIIDTKEKFIAIFGKGNTDTTLTHESGFTYHITADIDLSSSGYLPALAPFTGTVMGADNSGNPVKREINLGTVDSSESITYVMGSNNNEYVTGGGVFHVLDNADVSYLILKGNVTNRPGYSSGSLAGITNNYAKVSHVDSYVNLTSTKTAGGIIGVNYLYSTVENCVNYGTVKGAGAGGISGSNFGTNAYIKNCGNEGEVISSGHAGGITGQLYADITSCYNTGSISSTSASRIGVAGIAAYGAKAGVKIAECWNSGDLSFSGSHVESGVGSILGLNYASTSARKIIITNCFNTGKLTAGSGLMGAAIGNSYTAANEVHGFYSLDGSNAPLFSTSETLTAHVVESAYIVGDKTSGVDGLTYLTLDGIKALTTGEDTYFTSNKWTVKSGYSYPQLVSAPYIGEDFIIDTSNIFINNNISGEGTEENPYIIDTKEKFLSLFSDSNTEDTGLTHADGVYYLQTADLTIGAYSPCTAQFNGAYMGGSISDGVITLSNKVLDVTINEPGVQGVAIFPKFAGVEISHITIRGSVTGGKYTASLLGEEFSPGGSKITNVINEAAINGTTHSAGIVGLARTGMVATNCVNSGNVTTTGQYAGGIVGWANVHNKYVNCANTGTVSAGGTYAGGIAGAAYDTRIEKSYNTGSVSGTGQVGGIVGGYTMNNSNYTAAQYHGIHESWNSGTVDGGAGATAGIIGGIGQSKNISSQFSVTNCYNVGSIVSTHATAKSGLIGSISLNKDTTDHTYTVTITGFYDAGSEYDVTPYMGSTFDKSRLTVTSAYVLSDNTFTYAQNATKDELKALTTTDDNFKTSVWAIGSGNNPYPALTNNAYVGDALESPYIPEDSEVYYESGAYYVKWTAPTVADSYKVNVDGVTVNEAATSPCDITEYVRNKTASVQVVAVKGSKEYNGDTVAANGYFAGGAGVSGDPYLVADKYHLANVATKRNGYYEQTGNITGVTEPIMLYTTSNAFNGYYDGKGYSIDMNLVSPADWPDTGSNNTGFGLFPLITANAEIKDLTLTGTVTSYVVNTGALVGSVYSNNYTVSGIKNYATVTSTKNETAGIIGRSYRSGTIENCYNYADITGNKAAGIVGCTANGTVINNCGNYGDITATGSIAGGIATYCYGGAKNSFNVGTVKSTTIAAGIMAGMQPGKTSDSGYKAVTVENCYNLGTLVAPTTYGISYKTTANWYNLKNCYNAVYATNPLADVTSEALKEFNEANSVEFAVANNYYLTTDEADAGVEGKTPVTTLDGLKAIALDNSIYSISGDLAYPQLTANKLDADKDAIDFALVTVDSTNAVNTESEIKNIDASSFYVQKGFDGLVISVVPNDFYKVEVLKGAGSLGIFTNEDEIAIEVESDIVISFAEEAVEAVLPDSIGTSDKVFTDGDAITISEETYTRYALVAAKAEKASGLKLVRFGVLISHTDGDFRLTTSGVKNAVGDSEKISENGAYGILIHSNNVEAEKGLKDGVTYYTRPYAVYADKDGKNFAVYGEVRSFVLEAAAAE